MIKCRGRLNNIRAAPALADNVHHAASTYGAATAHTQYYVQIAQSRTITVLSIAAGLKSGVTRCN